MRDRAGRAFERCGTGVFTVVCATDSACEISVLLVLSFSDLTHGVVGFALGTHVTPATSMEIHTAYLEHPAILGMNTGPVLLPLGMILLGAGLLRSRAVPRFMAVVVMVTPLAIHASFALDLPTVVHGLLLATGMSFFAYALTSPRPAARSAAGSSR